MKNRAIVGLLLVCCVWAADANRAQLATPACDRECLRGQVTQLLHALVKHDVSGLPIADTLRVTEDAVEKPLAKVGLVGTVTRLRGFRQDIIDERAGVAGGLSAPSAVMNEAPRPGQLATRDAAITRKFAPGCQNISTQSLAIFQRLGDVQTRVIAVDERMGIVWLRMAWGARERGGDQLTVWETFKVYDGQIHAVEAFMRILPVEKRNGGWEQPAVR